MNEEKSYRNKDMMLSESEFNEAVTNDFIGQDFTEQLEWAMLMIQSNFKQLRFAEYLPAVTANHFDKAYLMSANLNDNQKFFAPFTDLQATPEIFPQLNLKFLNIQETIQLQKVKELDFKSKRDLQIKRKYAYQISTAIFNKKTESFYGIAQGFELNGGFFKLQENSLKNNVSINDLPNPISLHPNFAVPKDAIKYLSKSEIVDTVNLLMMSYQIAMSMYYEWSIYIKEYDNIGLVIPIEPAMLSEMYKTSLLKFDSKKRMLHFVRDHYRRKAALPNEDYSVFVQKYLRGEHKFDYKGFYAEIIPPKYDLNRVKTRKKFIDATV